MTTGNFKGMITKDEWAEILEDPGFKEFMTYRDEETGLDKQKIIDDVTRALSVKSLSDNEFERYQDNQFNVEQTEIAETSTFYLNDFDPMQYMEIPAAAAGAPEETSNNEFNTFMKGKGYTEEDYNLSLIHISEPTRPY